MRRLLFRYCFADRIRLGWRGLTRVTVAGAALWPVEALAASGEWMRDLLVGIDPDTAITLGSCLLFLTGFLAGVFTLHFLERFSGKGR